MITLRNLVLDRLRSEGVAHNVLNYDREPCTWRHVPLFTGRKIGDQPLQPYLDVSLEHSLYELMQVYEEFLDWFWRHNTKRSIPMWFAKRLGITPIVAHSLFAAPEGIKEGRRSHVASACVVYAALVSYNFGHTIEHAQDACIVSAQEYRFGVEGGMPISNVQPITTYRKCAVSHPGGLLCDAARGLQVDPDSDANAIRAALEALDPTLPDLAELVMLLNVFRSRSSYGMQSLTTTLSVTPTRKEVHAAIALCRRYHEFDYDRAREVMHRTLVSEFISHTRFVELLGRPEQAVIPDQWAKLDRGLDVLEDELLYQTNNSGEYEHEHRGHNGARVYA